MSTELKNNNVIREQVITQITEQFSDYDHHNQKLFIQFFSAVFVVLVGYGFVFANQRFLYVNTSSEQGTYSLLHLLAVYVVAQIILIFLSTLILNIGYCFRRDQLTLYNIRKYIFHDEEYQLIFGVRANNPLQKSLLRDSYLPTFNALFFRFIIFIQTLLCVSIIVAQETSPLLLDFVKNHRFTYIYIVSFPLLINLSEYVRFYIKYKSKVDVHKYPGEKVNRFLSLIQEGWATLIPLLLLLELLLHNTWQKVLIFVVEVSAWSLLLLFLFYLLKILRIEYKSLK